MEKEDCKKTDSEKKDIEQAANEINNILNIFFMRRVVTEEQSKNAIESLKPYFLDPTFVKQTLDTNTGNYTFLFAKYFTKRKLNKLGECLRKIDKERFDGCKEITVIDTKHYVFRNIERLIGDTTLKDDVKSSLEHVFGKGSLLRTKAVNLVQNKFVSSFAKNVRRSNMDALKILLLEIDQESFENLQ